MKELERRWCTDLTKQARQFAIKDVILTKSIGTQEALRRALGRRGFRVTQATLSRDMNDLRVSRLTQGGTPRYVLQVTSDAGIMKPIVGAEVVSITANEALIVVTTLPGCANTVGEYIDIQKHADIIGTVAGDNTLLVVPASVKKTQKVLRFLIQTLTEGAA
jgi:transcriptional regulator of arginine metabolism